MEYPTDRDRLLFPGDPCFLHLVPSMVTPTTCGAFISSYTFVSSIAMNNKGASS